MTHNLHRQDTGEDMDNEKEELLPFRDPDVAPESPGVSAHEFGPSRSVQRRLAYQKGIDPLYSSVEWRVVKKHCTPGLMEALLKKAAQKAYRDNAQIFPVDLPYEIAAVRYRSSVIPDLLENVFAEVLRQIAMDGLDTYRDSVIDFRLVHRLCSDKIKDAFHKLFMVEAKSVSAEPAVIPKITI
jgi:hypothetical protein